MIQKDTNNACLLIGGNLGNVMSHIEESKKQIKSFIGNIQSRSSIYQTAAWGNTNQPDFLNQVLFVQTVLSAEQCLHEILQIENSMGRIRTQKNAPRIIDIDILFYNDAIINTTSLIIPHPEIQNRRFVLMPLNEIASSFIHPLLKKTIRELLYICPDRLTVNKLVDQG